MRSPSLAQWIFLSYMLALLPAGLLMTQLNVSFTSLAGSAASEARRAVDLTRNLEKLKADAINIERSVLQYQVIQSEQTKSALNARVSEFILSLDNTCSILVEAAECSKVKSSLQHLQFTSYSEAGNTLNISIEQFHQALSDFQLTASRLIDERIHQQQYFAQDLSHKITWQTLALIVVTLILVTLLVRMVIRPVRKLQQMNNAVGTQPETMPDEHIVYPREFVDIENKLRWLADRLVQLESLRLTMLRHASHELKTPLAGIKEGWSLLNDQVMGEINPSQKEVLALMGECNERLYQLIEQLLDYNRLMLEAKNTPQWIESEQLLGDIKRNYRLPLQQNNMDIELDLAHAKLFADEGLVTRMMDNLINNAIAYGKSGSNIRIMINMTHSGQEITVSNEVKDTEAGIDPSWLQPFSRGNTNRNDGLTGTGLGLSIVDECARMMGGKAKIQTGETGLFCIKIGIPTQGLK